MLGRWGWPQVEVCDVEDDGEMCCLWFIVVE